MIKKWNKGTCGSHIKKTTKAKKKKKSEGTAEAWEMISQREKKKKNIYIYIYIYFFLFILSQIYENLTAGFRQDKHEKCFTRRGLRVSTKNTGFHVEFR